MAIVSRAGLVHTRGLISRYLSIKPCLERTEGL